MPRFFRLQDDMTTDRRWYLSGPTGSLDEWLDDALVRGQEYLGGQPLKVAIVRPGPMLEVTFTTETIPIVNERVAAMLRRTDRRNAQLIPAAVDGSSQLFFAVNVLPHPVCVDELASAPVVRWTEADGRPEMLGQYQRIGRLRLDAGRAGNWDLLRASEWPVAVIVSERLADLLRAGNVRCNLMAVT